MMQEKLLQLCPKVHSYKQELGSFSLYVFYLSQGKMEKHFANLQHSFLKQCVMN